MLFTRRIYGPERHHILPTLPRGWRWATDVETQHWHKVPDIRQVHVGPADEPWTDLAVPE